MTRALAGSRILTARERLREEPATIHQAPNALPAFVPRIERWLTLCDDRGLAGRLYGFHAPLERGPRRMRDGRGEIIESAPTTFSAMARWLSEVEHHV